MKSTIQARFVGALSERREKRINEVLDRFDVWKFVPSGQYVNGQEFQHTAVDWNEDEDGTEITFKIEDDKAERITSELRACGLIVTCHD